MGEDVGLDIAVVVLGSPDETSRRFNSLGNHVIDETMLVVDTRRLELRLVGPVDMVSKQKSGLRGKYGRLVNFLEDVLEPPVILLHDGVLGRQELDFASQRCALTFMAATRRPTRGIFLDRAILKEA